MGAGDVEDRLVEFRMKFASDTLDEFLDVYGGDLSSKGIFIRTSEALPVGTRVSLDLRHRNGAELISGVGTVAWVRQAGSQDEAPRGIEIRFDKLSPTSRSLIDAALKMGTPPAAGSRGAAPVVPRKPATPFAMPPAENPNLLLGPSDSPRAPIVIGKNAVVAPLKPRRLRDTAAGSDAGLVAQQQMFDGFISYRRKSNARHVAKIIQLSAQQIGKTLFLDLQHLTAGRFDEKLFQIIEQAPCLIAVLGPGSLDACTQEDDWLREELIHALRQEKTIIPILIEGFTFPDKSFFDRLPAEMADLPSYQSVRYGGTSAPEADWEEAAVQKALRYLEEAINRERQRAQARAHAEAEARARAEARQRAEQQARTRAQAVEEARARAEAQAREETLAKAQAAAAANAREADAEKRKLSERRKEELQKHYNDATRAYDIGLYAEAAAGYGRAYEVNGDPAMLYNIAQAHRLGGKPNEAMQQYRRYLELRPSAANREDVEEKIAKIEKLVESTNYQHYLDGAVRAFDLEHYAEAIAAYGKVYEITGDPAMLYNLGQAHSHNGEPDRALAYYQRYLQRASNPTNREKVERKIVELRAVLTAAEGRASVEDTTLPQNAAGRTILLPPPIPGTNADIAAQTNIEYQRRLSEWRALPRIRRFFHSKPEPPKGI